MGTLNFKNRTSGYQLSIAATFSMKNNDAKIIRSLPLFTFWSTTEQNTSTLYFQGFSRKEIIKKCPWVLSKRDKKNTSYPSHCYYFCTTKASWTQLLTCDRQRRTLAVSPAHRHRYLLKRLFTQAGNLVSPPWNATRLDDWEGWGLLLVELFCNWP